MNVEWNKFWCRVLFKEFIRHFRKMSDEQIVADIRQSMDDLEDMVQDSGTFGSKMVGWSVGRAEQYPMARENGKKGGRPPKTEIPLPKNKEEVRLFALDQGIDVDYAMEWAELSLKERKGKDASGKPIRNWKGALINFVKARKENADG